MGTGSSKRLADCNQLLTQYLREKDEYVYKLQVSKNELERYKSELEKYKYELEGYKSGVITDKNTEKSNLEIDIKKLNREFNNMYAENAKLMEENAKLMEEYSRLNNVRTELITNIKKEFKSNDIVEDSNKHIVSFNGIQKVAIIIGSNKLDWYTNSRLYDLSEEKKLLFLFDKNIINQIIDINTIVDPQMLINAVNALIEYILETYNVNFANGGRGYINTDNIKNLHIEWITKGSRFIINNENGDEDLIRESDLYITA